MYRFVLSLMLFVGLALLNGVASAQNGQSGGPAAPVSTSDPAIPADEEIPPGFRPVRGAPDVAQIDPNPLVVGAYATFFLGVFLYVVYLARLQTAMAKEMEELAEQIQKVDRA